MYNQLNQMFNNKPQMSGTTQIQQRMQQISVEEYNKYVLQALTNFDEMYGKKEGTLTQILFNSGLSIAQLQEAINKFKSE